MMKKKHLKFVEPIYFPLFKSRAVKVLSLPSCRALRETSQKHDLLRFYAIWPQPIFDCCIAANVVFTFIRNDNHFFIK